MTQLDEKGRCCGRKPLLYKRPRHELFCYRCDRAYNPKTGQQIENWAYQKDILGEFVLRNNVKYP